ncbi:MAG: Gfo/Idh/MocA family oxidoreductase [Candidatus Sumerlaeia bacterium]|nr:Gfo/Idh/MocA family oxidoreductase [Candidatus Sumerlaeia bacterium]
MAAERVVLAGLGSWGAGWYHALCGRYAEGQVAVVAPSPATRDRIRAGDAWHASLAEALAEGPPPRFLVNATPPHAHAELNLLAFARGVPVLCEKPIAATFDESRRCVEAARAAGVPFMVAENFRRAPAMRRAAELLRAGAIGPLGSMHAQLFQELRTDKPYWAAMRHAFLEDVAVHVLDMARCFAGAEAESLSALSFNPAGSWHPVNAACSVQARFRGGAAFTFSGGVATVAAHTDWMGQWRLEGARGAILVEGSRLRLATPEGGGAEDLAGAHSPGCLDEFLAHLSGGPEPETMGADYLRSQQLVHCAVLSAESGGAAVAVEPLP